MKQVGRSLAVIQFKYPVIALLLLVLMSSSVWPETLNRGLGPEPDSLDIHQAQGLAAINLLRDLREGLVTFDVNGEPVPGVAASWQVLDEGKRYRFTLREDARWSNADPVTFDLDKRIRERCCWGIAAPSRSSSARAMGIPLKEQRMRDRSSCRK